MTSYAYAAYSPPGSGYCGMPTSVNTAVITIESMPRTLRMRVEELMVDCLHSESTFVVPGDDPLTAQWCTRWFKDSSWQDFGMSAGQGGQGSACDSSKQAGIGCRQVITGTREEITALEEAVAGLAAQWGFSAKVQLADSASM